jgi:glc operon protein GlcG
MVGSVEGSPDRAGLLKDPQVLVQRSLGLDEASQAIARAVEYAKEKNWRIAAVVVDRTGELVACARMDGRATRFLKAAHRKAYTAATFEMDTSGLIKFWNRQEAEGHRGPHDWNDPMLTTLPGGICVVHDGKVVGAIGVAGGGGVEGVRDWDFAEVAFKALGPGFAHSDTMHQDQPVYLAP